jgi:hypothetical protein
MILDYSSHKNGNVCSSRRPYDVLDRIGRHRGWSDARACSRSKTGNYVRILMEVGACGEVSHKQVSKGFS